MRASLAPFLGEGTPIEVDSTRLQPPTCFWSVYRSGDRWAALKVFFVRGEYASYAATLAEYHPERIDRPDHPAGGIRLLPELNGVLWGFPFDPAMPELGKCLDGRWVGELMGRRGSLQPRIVDYNPEIGATIAYRDPSQGRVVAFGKASPHETSGLIYIVMDRLWRSQARETGSLKLAKPLAFRAEADFLLQTRVRGKPIGSDRNRAVFLDLVDHAGGALAGVHAADIPFGPKRGLAGQLARLHESVAELALTSPRLNQQLVHLLVQLNARAERTPEQTFVPSHGDFKYDQFLQYRHHFVLIDFEMFCQAEPSLDLGTFCAYLPPSRPSGWEEAAAAELLRGAFLRSYEKAAGRPIDYPRLALHEAAMLAIRGMSYAWRQRTDWQLLTGQLLDLALDRLVDPEPRTSTNTDAGV